MAGNELKPVKCGCGGDAHIETCTTRFEQVPRFRIRCEKCNISTIWDYFSEAEAIRVWNKAMGVKKMPTTNMTILHRKIDLLSILQAIKSDKIRVWMSYDGKIRFRNTKTGNEIEVNPYYDMEGEEYHE